MLLSPLLLNVLGILFLTFWKAFVYTRTKMLGSFIEMEIQIVFRSLTVSAVKFILTKML